MSNPCPVAPLSLSPTAAESSESPSHPSHNHTASLSRSSLISDVSVDARSAQTGLEDDKEDEDVIPESELRRIFDDEEVDRFLGLFADYVSEVTVHNPSIFNPDINAVKEQTFEIGTDSMEDNLPSQDEEETPEDARDWVSIDDAEMTADRPLPQMHSLSEQIASKYLIPYLPPAQPTPDRFTMGRLRLSVQRFHLVAQPTYGPFFKRLIDLATWKNQKESAVYCTTYWCLWFHNMLLPALFCRILYSLIRRKISPYPTLSALRERRREVARAEEFGQQLQTRLGASSDFGMIEAWRLFRVFSKPKKNKIKHKRTTVKGKIAAETTGENPASEGADGVDIDDVTVLDDPRDSQEERTVKRVVIVALSEIADLHERVKNIFLWRRPPTSKVYAAVLTLLLLVTLCIPAKYLAKLTYLIGGIFFWHVAPVIAALPPAERARLPPAFGDSQTDAEYAMQLISQRVARGDPIILPSRKQKKTKKTTDTRSSSPQPGIDKQREADAEKSKEDLYKEVDWRKWGDRAVMMQSWADHSMRWLGRREAAKGGTQPSQHAPEMKATSDESGKKTDTCTFLAQRNATPGILTLTQSALLFTSITSSKVKIQIELERIRGVKKIGAMKGLSVRWQGTGSESSDMHEERFRWVGGRDELFARLVGWGGRRWLKV